MPSTQVRHWRTHLEVDSLTASLMGAPGNLFRLASCRTAWFGTAHLNLRAAPFWEVPTLRIVRSLTMSTTQRLLRLATFQDVALLETKTHPKRTRMLQSSLGVLDSSLIATSKTISAPEGHVLGNQQFKGTRAV